MKKHIALSGVALTALMLATEPAAAQLLTIDGNNGSTTVTLGGGNNAPASTTVDLGGSPDAAVNLGGGTNTNATIDLGGGAAANANATIGNEDANVELLGTGGDGGTEEVRIGTTGPDGDVVVDLFGSDGDRNGVDADVRIGSELLDLFGSDGSGSRVSADIGQQRGGSDAQSDAVIELFGPGDESVDPTETGSVAGEGGDGARGTTGGGTRATRTDSRIATTADRNTGRRSGSCFSPDGTQIAYLLNQVDYNASVAASWRQAGNISVVPLNICPDQRARIEAAISSDSDFTQMQAAVDATASIKAGLNGQYEADDVLAVKGSGDALAVYVY